MNNTIYVVTYVTESCDSGMIGYFNRYPTDGRLTALFKELMPDEFRVYEGTEQRLVFWDVHELNPVRLPRPVKLVAGI